MVIISGNLLNANLSVIIACPLTTQIKGYKGNIILNPDNINKLKKVSEVLIFHIRSISKDRLVRKIGMIKKEELELIKQGLSDILRY